VNDRYALIKYRDHSGLPRVGSGLLVRDNTVLTADHVASGDASSYSVEFSGGRFGVREIVRSFTSAVDLAVLILSDPAECAAMRYARVDRSSQVRLDKVTAVGYPKWKVYRRRRRTAQVEGSVRPGEDLSTMADGGADGQLLTLEGDRTPPKPIPAGMLDDPSRSYWEGMSGAAVIARGMVIGVIHSDNREADGKSLTVTPLTALKNLRNDSRERFCAALDLEDLDNLPVLTGDNAPALLSAVPASHTAAFRDAVKDRYRHGLTRAGLEIPEQWDYQELDRLRRKCEAEAESPDAALDLLRAAALLQAVDTLKTLCIAVEALPLLRNFGGDDIGITRLEYLYLRHVGCWPEPGNGEEMLIRAASAGEVERDRTRSEPGYRLPHGLSALERFMLGIAGHSKASLAATLADPGLRGLADWVKAFGHQGNDARDYLDNKVGGRTWVLIEMEPPEVRQWPTAIVVDTVPEGEADPVRTKRFPCAANSEEEMKAALRRVVSSCLSQGKTRVDLSLSRHWLRAGMEHWDVVEPLPGRYQSMMEDYHPRLRWAMHRREGILLDRLRERTALVNWRSRPVEIPLDTTSDPARFLGWCDDRNRDGTLHPPFFIGSLHGADNHDPLGDLLLEGYGFALWFSQETTPGMRRQAARAANGLTEQQRRDDLPSRLARELVHHQPAIIWSDPNGREGFRLPLRPATRRSGTR
jgi:hypothetical protein